MIPVIIFGSALLLILTYFIYTSNANTFIKCTALIAFLISSTFAVIEYNSQLGAPINKIPDGVIYMHHESADGKIYLWGYSKELGDRLYVFDHTKDREEDMQESYKRNIKGRVVQITADRHGDSITDPSFELDDWFPENELIGK